MTTPATERTGGTLQDQIPINVSQDPLPPNQDPLPPTPNPQPSPQYLHQQDLCLQHTTNKCQAKISYGCKSIPGICTQVRIMLQEHC